MDKMSGVQLVGSIIGIVIATGGLLSGAAFFLIKTFFKRNTTIADSNFQDNISHSEQLKNITATLGKLEKSFNNNISTINSQLSLISSEHSKLTEALARIDSSLIRIHKRIDNSVSTNDLNITSTHIVNQVKELKLETKEDLKYLRESVHRLGKGQSELSSSLSYYKGKFETIS